MVEQVTTFGSNMGVPGLESCQPPKKNIKNISRTASADNTISLIVGYQCLTKRTNVPKLFWVGRVSPTPFCNRGEINPKCEKLQGLVPAMSDEIYSHNKTNIKVTQVESILC